MSHESEVGRIRPWAAARGSARFRFGSIGGGGTTTPEGGREGLSLPPPRKARLVRHARPSVVSATAERGAEPIVVIVACDRSRLVRRVARRRSSCSPHSVARSAHRHLRAIAVPPCAALEPIDRSRSEQFLVGEDDAAAATRAIIAGGDEEEGGADDAPAPPLSSRRGESANNSAEAAAAATATPPLHDAKRFDAMGAH